MVNAMKVKAPAKINLALDVCGILENGYHSIKSVFQTVSLYDEVTVHLNDSGMITVNCRLPDEFALADPVPSGEKNIAYKAARLFLDTINSKHGCDITIVKGIPSQAGMGGGSTDAAAVIRCLNELTGANLDISSLTSIGKTIGADVPFFFTGGTAFVSGIGEEIVPLPAYGGKILVIAKGTHGVSTAKAYKAVDDLESPLHPDADGLAEALRNDPDNAYKYFGNTFESAIDLPEISHIRNSMMDAGALSAVMTGSGSAVFGLFRDMNTAENCCKILEKQGFFANVCITENYSE